MMFSRLLLTVADASSSAHGISQMERGLANLCRRTTQRRVPMTPVIINRLINMHGVLPRQLGKSQRQTYRI